MKCLILIAVCCALIGSKAIAADASVKAAESSIVTKCKADLAGRLKLQAQNIKVIEVEAVAWPNTALGMPEIDKAYAQMMTPGSRVTLEAKGINYLYTTSDKAFRYGGPVSIWSCSMLYSKPVKDEPNLNGDLYQCSLLGTNSVRLISEVSDYYPQEKGVVIIKRRTSRSSHDLLYLEADDTKSAKTLYSALDFGQAATNEVQDTWAGYVRPALGTDWKVVVAPVGGDSSKARTLPLPGAVKPGCIAWSGDLVMILVNKGDRQTAYEISPKAGASEWKEVGAHTFPGTDFMLNKSETLEINKVTADGKPGVEVARVWFTGDRNVIANVSDFTMRGYDLLGGRYAFVWGEKASKPAAYTVDIATGEVIPAAAGIGRDIKPFLYPPQSSPLTPKKPQTTH